MIIKAIYKEPWREQEKRFHTWYVPFEDQVTIQHNINFALSHKLTHYCTAGDYRLLGQVLNACENFESMNAEAQEALIKEQSDLELIF